MKKQLPLSVIVFLLITVILFFTSPEVMMAGTQQGFYIEKPTRQGVLNFAGDDQYQSVTLRLEKPVRIRVLDSLGRPVANYPVYFKVATTPADARNYALEHEMTLTDSLGIAKTFFTLGDKDGLYTISAEIKGIHKNAVEVFRITGRKSNWVFFLVIGLCGGLVLFFLGLSMLSEGLTQAAGRGMRSIIGSITKNRLVAVGVGALFTVVVQSSSATTVMLVSMVHSGLMTFTQSLGIILGADIGTTITTQLIAFKLTDYSLLLVAIGFIFDFFFKGEKIRLVGKAIMGAGLIFYGMFVMSESMYPLRSYEPFLELLTKLENPLTGILVGFAITALIQSSGAFIGIVIVLSMQGLVSLEAAIPLLFGANIGTAITAILASLKADNEARKVALAHTVFKVIGVIIFVGWIPQFADIIEIISPKGSPDAEGLSLLSQIVPRQIANAHTIFNVTLTVLALPFTNLFARAMEYFIPKTIREEEEQIKPKFLDNTVIGTPPLALSLAKQEILRMTRFTQEMIDDILLVFFTKEKYLLENIEDMENKINLLSEEIIRYITRTMAHDSTEKSLNESFQMMYTVKEFEQIADIVAKNLASKAGEWIDKDQEFSESGRREIIRYHEKVQKQVSRAIEVFRDVNLEKAKSMKGKYKEYKSMAMELEKQHYLRLKAQIKESMGSSEYHLDIIDMLQIITRHATNVARILIQWSEKSDKENYA